MEQLEKLEKIIIEDNLNLSDVEIMERAQDIVVAKSLAHGWQSCELKPSNITSTATPGYRRFEFDVFGIAGEGLEVTTTSNKDKAINSEKSAAAHDVDL